MTVNQKALLLAAIKEWVSIQPSENAVPRMAEIEADLDRVTPVTWPSTRLCRSAPFSGLPLVPGQATMDRFDRTHTLKRKDADIHIQTGKHERHPARQRG